MRCPSLSSSRSRAKGRPKGFPLEIMHTLSDDQAKGCKLARLILVTGGRGRFHQRHHSGKVSAGFVLIVPPGVPFRFSENEGLEMRVVGFNPAALRMSSWHIARDSHFKLLFNFSRAKAPAPAKVRSFCLIPRIFEQAAAQVGEIERETAQQLTGWRDICASHFQHLIVMLSRFHELRLRISHDSARRVSKAIRHIEKSYHERIYMEELARDAAVSPRTFYRIFLQATGLTPNAKLKKVRLSHASEKLRQTDDPVTDIAYACGFSDSNFFSREFHRAFDMSPTHYRHIWQA